MIQQSSTPIPFKRLPFRGMGVAFFVWQYSFNLLFLSLPINNIILFTLNPNKRMKQLYQRTLLALLALMPTAMWAQTFTQDNLSYTVTGEGTVSVSKTAGLTGDVYIPSSVVYEDVTYAVTAIPEYAFGNTTITSVTIPASVGSVGARAFQLCNSLSSIVIEDSETPLQWLGGTYYTPLFNMSNTSSYTLYLGRDLFTEGDACYFPYATSVTIGDQVTTINESLFKNAAKLGSVTIGNGVTSIGANAFQGTGTAVETQYISMGNNVTTIGANAFQGCSKLTEITLPDVLTAIPEYAFGNTGLTSITIPASVGSVGKCAFQLCHSLSSITIADCANPLQWFGGTYMPLYNMSNTSSYELYLGRDLAVSDVRCYFPYATSVTIGDQVTTINESLFQNAAKLGSVTIGNGVTSIGAYAFQGTGTDVETQCISMGNNVTTIGANAFQGCSKLTEITLPDVLTASPEYAFGNTGLTSITIPASVGSVGKCAFQLCNSLSSITIADCANPLQWLGGVNMPLYNMSTSSSYDVYLGRDLAVSDSRCYFPYATSVTIGDKVTAINSQLFQSATKLESVTLGSGVTAIGSYAFDGCSLLSSVDFTNATKLASIQERAFNNCDAITDITIPASVTTIESSAFWNMDAAINVTIEDSETPLTLNCVGTYYPIFEANASVTAYVGRNIVRTGNYANRPTFDNSLVGLTFGPKVTAIGDNEYLDCSNLEGPVYGLTNVESIGAKAFNSCKLMTSIELGNKLATLGEYAFQDCQKLGSIALPGTLKKIPTEAFENCFALGTVSLGEGIEEIGNGAFYDTDALTEITIPASVKKIGRAPFYCNNAQAMTRMIIADSDTPLEFANGSSEYTYGRANLNDDVTLDYFYLGRDINRASTQHTLVYNCKNIEIGPKVTNIDQLFDNTGDGSDVVETVKVHGLTPIAISTDPFHSNTYANATLWVPGGTKAAYQAADYWKNFTNIETWSFVLNYTVNGHGTMDIDGEAAGNGETKTVRKPNGDGLANSNWTWTVTPDAGYELTSLTVEDKTEATDPAVREIFVGNAGWENPHTEGTAINHDLDYVATFAPITYAITYDLAGGTVATANPATYNVESAAITLVNPTREGYTFAGWTGTALEGSAVEVSIPAGSTGDRTYTATWTPITYTIDYDLAGGSVAGNLPASYTIESAAITLVNPTRTGYTFKGWKLDGAGEAQMAVTIAAGSTGNKAYTATWQINQYTITFDSNGGSEVDAITQDYNTAVTPPAAPTKTGYTFAGWNQAVPATIPAENVTLTAQWTINQYTITFNTGGGSEVAAITQDYASAVTAPAAPTKTGYTFKGWTPDVPMKIPAENVTVTAQWQINQYTITFNTDGGTNVAAITQDYGTAVTAPAAPTKTGYTFAGWTPAVPATIPAENMTLTAQWTINTYSVSITGAGVTADNMNPKYQDDVVITIAEDPDRALTSLKVNGEEVKDDMVGNTYTIESVAGNVTVVATFASTKEFITLPASSDMATFSCSQALDFTGVEDLKAYIASGFDGTTVLLTRVEKVPANTGLLLLGTPGATYKVPYAETTAYYSNLLKPVLTATTVAQTDGAGNTNYLLGKQGDPEVIGFYKAKSEGSAVGAQKAYLQLPSGAVAAGVKSVGFYFDDTTAVEEVPTEAAVPEGVFDIHGRKIPAGQKLTRGIYIINGKKVSIK